MVMKICMLFSLVIVITINANNELETTTKQSGAIDENQNNIKLRTAMEQLSELDGNQKFESAVEIANFIFGVLKKGLLISCEAYTDLYASKFNEEWY